MTTRQIVCSAIFSLLSIGFICRIAVAQETSATMSGAVTDESGAVVPGVTVAVKNVATGVVRTAVTDGGGRYTLPELAPGNYEVEASAAGFTTFVRSGIGLTVGRHATVDIPLKVGSVGQKIEVTGEASLVETTSAGLAGLVGDKQIRDLPLNGRNFVQLTLLETGVVQSRAAGTSSVIGGGLKMNVNGARMDNNNFMMDGATYNSVNQQAIGGTSGEAMGVETIQEYQVLTSNYGAEFGRAAGGVVNVVTKSGTNQLHGSLLEFLRNSALDARNFFDGASVPPYKRNQFGATLGGPIKRDKTFIFGGYEALRERLGKTQIANVPTSAARLGNLPSGTVAVNSAVVPYLALWPLPTPGGRDNRDGTAEFDNTGSQPTNQDFGQVRADHVFSDKDSFFGRYTIDDSTQEIPQPIPSYVGVNIVRAQNAAIGETRIFSATVLNVLRFAFNRSNVGYDQNPLASAISDKSLWFFPTPLSPGVGTFGISGLGEAGGQTNLPKHRLDNVWQVVDTISRTSGRNSMKFGGEFQRIQTNENDSNQGQGVYSFANLTNFLRAQPATFVSPLPTDTFVRGWRQMLAALFIQDDLRLKPRLTLNLGLRWEMVTNPTDVNGRSAHYEDLFGADNLVVGNPLIEIPKLNFAPRTGFAWDVFGNGKTSVRGGFGIYDQMLFRSFYLTGRQIPPFINILSENANPGPICFPHPLECASAQQPLAPQLDQFKHNKTPYVMHWNMTVEREILPSTVLTVGYVASRGLHLSRFVSPNVAVPTILSDGQYFYIAGSPRRDPKFQNVVFKSLRASSMYNALQVKLARRLSKGLQAQLSYSWSHSLDNASSNVAGDYQNGNADPQNPWNINRTEWSNSSFDIRQSMTANFTYTLPFGAASKGVLAKLMGGWQANGILSVITGVPVDIENSASLNQDRGGTGNVSRPSLVAGRSASPVLGGPDKYFDVNAFILQAPGFYGNVGRNTLQGPGLTEFDFALVKNTGIGEKKNIQFRAEVFNLFNHANFDIPNHTVFLAASGVPSGSAGRISGTVTSSRQLQFGLKVAF